MVGILYSFPFGARSIFGGRLMLVSGRLIGPSKLMDKLYVIDVAPEISMISDGVNLGHTLGTSSATCA